MPSHIDPLADTVRQTPPPGQPVSTGFPRSTSAFRPLVSDQEIANQVKKRRPSISKNLVDTSGADFVYSDRIESFKVLADSCKSCRHRSYGLFSKMHRILKILKRFSILLFASTLPFQTELLTLLVKLKMLISRVQFVSVFSTSLNQATPTLEAFMTLSKR